MTVNYKKKHSKYANATINSGGILIKVIVVDLLIDQIKQFPSPNAFANIECDNDFR